MSSHRLGSEFVFTGTKLYLLGGTEALIKASTQFAKSCESTQPKIAILLQGGPDWRKYWPTYEHPFNEAGIEDLSPVVPSQNGYVDPTSVSDVLNNCDGIVIGGGQTSIYWKIYVASPVRDILLEKYHKGTVFMGISAGALLMPNYCILYPSETGKEFCQCLRGLGFIRNQLVGVAFGESGGAYGPTAGMALTRTKLGWGLNKTGCAVFEDGQFVQPIGKGVYKVEITEKSGIQIADMK